MTTPKNIRLLTIRIAILLAAAAAMTSCIAGDNNPPPPQSQRAILVYMGGDNNLYDKVEEKVLALEQGWTGSRKSRLLIYTDMADQSPCLLEITAGAGGGKRKVLETYADQNSADSRVFADAIRKMKKLCPAESYGLIVFSHGSGWLPAGALDNPKNFPSYGSPGPPPEGKTRGIIVDGNSEMPIAEFASAIPDGMFDYIVFEACLMGGIEVVYELKDKADYVMVSSAEILDPGFTRSYRESIDKLVDGDVKGFAQSSFNYFDLKSGNLRSATFSVIKTSLLDRLANWVAGNCDTKKAVDLNQMQRFNRSGRRLMLDFHDYFTAISPSASHDDLDMLLRQCVVWEAATPQFLIESNGFVIESHSGLTTYVMQDDLDRLNAEYKKLSWAKRILGNDM